MWLAGHSFHTNICWFDYFLLLLICLFIYLSGCLFITISYLFIFIFIPVYPSICTSIFISISLNLSILINLSAYLSIFIDWSSSPIVLAYLPVYLSHKHTNRRFNIFLWTNFDSLQDSLTLLMLHLINLYRTAGFLYFDYLYLYAK